MPAGALLMAVQSPIWIPSTPDPQSHPTPPPKTSRSRTRGKDKGTGTATKLKAATESYPRSGKFHATTLMMRATCTKRVANALLHQLTRPRRAYPLKKNVTTPGLVHPNPHTMHFHVTDQPPHILAPTDAVHPLKSCHNLRGSATKRNGSLLPSRLTINPMRLQEAAAHTFEVQQHVV